MAALTYSTLIDTVHERLDRTDLSDVIPDLITRVEEELNGRLGAHYAATGQALRPTVTVATATFDEGQEGLPSDFLDIIRLTLTDGTDTWVLSRLSLGDINNTDFYTTRALPYRVEYDSTIPQHYYIAGSTIYLTETPSSALTGAMIYTAKIPALTSTNTTNWITVSHSNVYEFGVTAHAARHIRDDEETARNIELFNAAVDSMFSAYPEFVEPTELRATDGHWSKRSWNIYSG